MAHPEPALGREHQPPDRDQQGRQIVVEEIGDLRAGAEIVHAAEQQPVDDANQRDGERHAAEDRGRDKLPQTERDGRHHHRDDEIGDDGEVEQHPSDRE